MCLLLNKNDFPDLVTTVAMRDLNQVWQTFHPHPLKQISLQSLELDIYHNLMLYLLVAYNPHKYKHCFLA